MANGALDSATAPTAKRGFVGVFAIAAGHLSYWGGGAMLGVLQGWLAPSGAASVGVWLALLTIWGLLVRRLSRSGWLASAALPTRPGLWLPPSAVILTVTSLLILPGLRHSLPTIVQTLPAAAMLSLHGLRVLAIGTVIKAGRGEIPRSIGYGVGGADTFFGAVSVVLALGAGFDGMGPYASVIYHGAGAFILLAMLPLLDASMPRKPGFARGARDARALLDDPLVLAPAVLATLFLIHHGAVLAALIAD